MTLRERRPRRLHRHPTAAAIAWATAAAAWAAWAAWTWLSIGMGSCGSEGGSSQPQHLWAHGALVWAALPGWTGWPLSFGMLQPVLSDNVAGVAATVMLPPSPEG